MVSSEKPDLTAGRSQRELREGLSAIKDMSDMFLERMKRVTSELPEAEDDGQRLRNELVIDAMWKVHTGIVGMVKSLRWALGESDRPPVAEALSYLKYMIDLYESMDEMGELLKSIGVKDFEILRANVKWRGKPDFRKAFGEDKDPWSTLGGIE